MLVAFFGLGIDLIQGFATRAFNGKIARANG